MTSKGIMAAHKKENIVHETALAMRKLLDEARKQYGAEAWDGEDAEQRIIDLLTNEDE